MDRRTRRISREKKTARIMMEIYCRGNHTTRTGLCIECKGLLEYSQRRLDACPLANEKPTCARCPVHCYEASRRSRMREVMRFSGPRMMARHPVLAIRHLADDRRDKKRARPGRG